MVKDVELALLYDYYGSFLTEKQADIFDLFYNEDLSLSEIGEHLGITRQGVRDSLKRGEEIMANMEDKIGMVKKSRGIMRATEILKDISNEIIISSGSKDKINELNRTIEELMTSV
ncbi:MAG: hypothetical protein FWE47_02335 [Oscillospiraceae bacterium]|nr:hypothetical protein [Oscillospiraceae bacterium]